MKMKVDSHATHQTQQSKVCTIPAQYFLSLYSWFWKQESESSATITYDPSRSPRHVSQSTYKGSFVSEVGLAHNFWPRMIRLTFNFIYLSFEKLYIYISHRLFIDESLKKFYYHFIQISTLSLINSQPKILSFDAPLTYMPLVQTNNKNPNLRISWYMRINLSSIHIMFT